MMASHMRSLGELMVVLLVLLWACRFIWRRYRKPGGRPDNACKQCDKCGH